MKIQDLTHELNANEMDKVTGGHPVAWLVAGIGAGKLVDEIVEVGTSGVVDIFPNESTDDENGQVPLFPG